MRILSVSLAIVLALSGPLAAATVTDPNLVVTTWVSGLRLPTAIGFIGGDDILVLEIEGLVRRVTGGVLQAGDVLDLIVSDRTGGERGALGLAIDPDFAHTGFVYINYTESSTQNDGDPPAGLRLYRYRWDGAALVEPSLILDLPVLPGPTHCGGPVLFGPDDNLYLMIGDLNRQGQLQNVPGGAPPDDTSVIFRVERSGAGLPDNPLGGGAPLDRYFAYGIRNGFGIAFDPLTGDLWDSENGPASYDEVNRVEPGSNGGWRQIMGPDARDPQGVGDLWQAPGSFYSDPEFSWEDPVAPTAVAFAGSPLMGCGNLNRMFVGGVNCGHLYRFRLQEPARASLQFDDPALSTDLVADNLADTCASEQSEIIFGSGFGTVTDIENGPDGLLYVLSLNGFIYRIGPTGAGLTDLDGDLVDAGCDCDDGDAGAFAVPTAVPLIRLSGASPLGLGWDPQAGRAGSGTRYSVISGLLSDLHADGNFDSACTDADGLVDPEAIDTRPDPPLGDGYYFLVRAGNGCGDGTFGDSSLSPDPRDWLDGTLPPSCP